jgi:hypothetical protein
MGGRARVGACSASSYTSNLLNQYTQRPVPRAFNFVGYSAAGGPTTLRCATPIRCSKRVVVSDVYSPPHARRAPPTLRPQAHPATPHNPRRIVSPHVPGPDRQAQSAARTARRHSFPRHNTVVVRTPVTLPQLLHAPINPTPCFIPPIRATLFGAAEQWSRGEGEKGSEKRGWASWRRLNFATSLFPPTASSTS